MFSVNQEVSFEGRTSNIIDAQRVEANKGIFMNCSLKKVIWEESKEGNGNYVLNFYFEDSEGNTFKHTEWQPDPARDDFEKKFNNMNLRVGHILTKFGVSEAACKNNKGATLQEFMQNYVPLITDYSQKVNLKITLNDKNYSVFTPYLGFIEKYEEGKTSNLRVGNKEKIKSTKADSNPADLGSSAIPESIL